MTEVFRTLLGCSRMLGGSLVTFRTGVGARLLTAVAYDGLGRRTAVEQGPALQSDGVFCRCDSRPGGTCLEQALKRLGVGCVQDQAAGGFWRPRTKVPGRAPLWIPCSKVISPDWMVAR